MRHNRLLVKFTLVFFVTMVIVNPAYAAQTAFYGQQGISSNTRIPVSQVTQEQADEIIREANRRGYSVQEATMQQLAELEQTDQELEQTAQVPDEKDDKSKEQPCSKSNTDDQGKDPEEGKSEEGKSDEAIEDITNKEQVNKAQGEQKEQDCKKEAEDQNNQEDVESEKPMAVTFPNPQPVPESAPQQVPPPPPPTQPPVQANIEVQADVGYSHGGGGDDFAKVFFILAGVVVIAAFIVYTGKYIVDLATGKDVKPWWEFLLSSTYLDTRSGEHGWLHGLKIATGFVSSDLIQVALLGELGKTSVDVILDDKSDPVRLDYTATYWMVGASARLLLADRLANASYLYLDFMGGKTSRGITDYIGIARLGASFGIKNNARLGVNIGSHYIGLNENQGFANHGDNYWTTLGFELGVTF